MLLGSFLLVRHPKVMEKLRAEINSLPVTKEKMNRGDLRNLHYLQNILKESESPQVEQHAGLCGPNTVSSSVIPICACQHAHINQNNDSPYRRRS